MLQGINVKLQLKFAIELQTVYLRDTTYLRTPLFGMIPVLTLFVVCAGAVRRTNEKTDWLKTLYLRLCVWPSGGIMVTYAVVTIIIGPSGSVVYYSKNIFSLVCGKIYRFSDKSSSTVWFVPRDAMNQRSLCHPAVAGWVGVCPSRSCIVSKRLYKDTAIAKIFS